MTAAVTGWAVHLPGAAAPALAPAAPAAPAVPPERAHELLGRRGLLAKEPATRLALCAVRHLLGPPSGGPPDPRTGVVVSSNLGNVATVRRVAGAATVRDVSVLEAPNASSNVIASTIAIWFRLGGPNLTVCSGAGSGLDAVALGTLLLRAGRADRVVVVGAEPDDEVAAAVHRGRGTACGAPLRAGAAAVLLEAAAGPACLGPFTGAAPVLIGPASRGGGADRVIDLAREAGDPYGALGVIQVALAAALVAGGACHVDVTCGDDVDGWRSAGVHGGGAD